MTRPLVSILIPCHNAVPYVQAAVASALNQTWPNKEIVIVDDGSTDGTWEIVKTFQAPGIKVVRHRKFSAAATRNRAFQESTGDFVKFLDSDDLLSPQTIEWQMGRIVGENASVATAEWGRFYRDDLATFRLNHESVWRDMDSRDWLVESWTNARPMMQPGLFLLPRPLLTQAGPWDEHLSLIDDFEFFARVLSLSSQVRFAPGARLYYRSGLTGNLSARKDRNAVESAFNSLRAGTSHLLARRKDAKAKLACSNVLQDFIYTHYPNHPDLLSQISRCVRDLGGSDLPPSGPPRFEALRPILGWKLARRIQRIASNCGGRFWRKQNPKFS